MKFKEIKLKCVRCGATMTAFKRSKRYCDACYKQLRNGKSYRRKKVMPLSSFDKLNHKLLEDSAAADARGLTYGYYMAEKREGKQ